MRRPLLFFLPEHVGEYQNPITQLGFHYSQHVKLTWKIQSIDNEQYRFNIRIGDKK